MTLDKLKFAARQHEQRDEWRAAIELYRQAIREGEEASEGTDPSLYNRIGDLEQKAGELRAACEAWEQAVARYGDLGFSNNAIAICAKILRVDPTRTRVHLELARFQARKGMFHDASRDMQFYFDRMHRDGREEAARDALLILGDEFPNWEALQQLLDRLLGRERSQDPDQPARGTTSHRGHGLVFIDTSPLELERASEPASSTTHPLGLEPTVVEGIELERPSEGSTLSGLESTSSIESRPPADEPSVEGLIEVRRTAAEVGETPSLAGLQVSEETDSSAIVPRLAGLEPDPSGVDDLTTPQGDPLVFLETGETAGALPSAPAIPAAAADDPLGQRAAGYALLEIGDRAGAIAAFERALQLYQQREEWAPAWQAATELIQAEPQRIGHYQTRVEIASFLNDSTKRTDAYLDLADALRRAGSDEKAIAVYRRVLEHEAEQPRALAALRDMSPAPVVLAGDEGFIDFRAMVVDDGPRTTRMRTETTKVSANEDETFREALAEFKRALDENMPLEDSQAHYDLGVAFKEMGLLDEAVSSFQKALRSPEGRLRTSEALGQTFFDQGRVAVAEAVLRNAERGPEPESEKIGVLYWLGRSLEAQGKDAEALTCYQRVLAVDVLFMDVSERLLQVTDRSGV